MKNNLNNENELLIRISKGDELAFQQLVKDYSNRVFSQAMTFAKTWHQAEEITQDIFMHIWKKREKLNEVDNLDNFIFIVSKNFLLSHIRKKIHEADLLSINKNTSIDKSTAETLENKELGIMLEKAINQLPIQKQQVFRLIHQEGLSQEQVAQKLSIATRTVRWNLVSAIKAIKAYLYKYASGDLLLILVFLLNAINN